MGEHMSKSKEPLSLGLTPEQLGHANNPTIHSADPLASDSGEPTIEVRQSTISQRWAYYINGERCGSAPSKRLAEKAAREYVAEMKR